CMQGGCWEGRRAMSITLRDEQTCEISCSSLRADGVDHAPVIVDTPRSRNDLIVCAVADYESPTLVAEGAQIGIICCKLSKFSHASIEQLFELRIGKGPPIPVRIPQYQGPKMRGAEYKWRRDPLPIHLFT